MTKKNDIAQFELPIRLPPSLFFNIEAANTKARPKHFFPIRSLDPGVPLITAPYELTENLTTNFAIKAVGQGCAPEALDDIVGFLFESSLPVQNYGTSLLAYSKAWQQTAAKVEVLPDELLLSLKGEHFFIYHAAGKATLITGVQISDALHDYLTMTY